MASDCLGLLLGFTVPLFFPSCQGLMHMPVNDDTGHAGFAVWNCVWVLGVKSASGLLLFGGHRGLHWFFRFVQVFSIPFALPAICADFVHELGTTGDR